MKVKSIIASGGFIDDDLAISIIEDKLSNLINKNINIKSNKSLSNINIIFDGFPRTLAQAKSLDEMLNKRYNKSITNVIFLDVDKQLLIERVCGRRLHLSSGRSYHVKFKPPKIENKDDVTGEDLVHRTDDNEESFDKRYNEYLKYTTHILNHYDDKCVHVNGDDDSDNVFNKIISNINKDNKLNVNNNKFLINNKLNNNDETILSDHLKDVWHESLDNSNSIENS